MRRLLNLVMPQLTHLLARWLLLKAFRKVMGSMGSHLPHSLRLL
jgi:hypothetical protein